MKDTGKVNIHGKEYTTVAARVQQFREGYADQEGKQYGLVTKLVSRDSEMVVMKASIIDSTGRVLATGYAEEKRSASTINRTSALENAETSAIGRALAAFGLAGTEYASADEVANAINQQSQKPAVGTSTTPLSTQDADTTALATAVQKSRIRAFLRSRGIDDENMTATLIMQYGIEDPKTMTKAQADALIKELAP